MTRKSLRVEFTDNTYVNYAGSGQGVVCAVRDVSSNEWIKNPGDDDLGSEKVIFVCLKECKECDFDPPTMNCLKGEKIIVVKTFGAKFTVIKLEEQSD